MVHPVRLENEPPSPENSGRTVIRAVEKGQRARGIPKNETQLLVSYAEQCLGWLVGLGMCR